jgi:hypothetical protein
MAKFKIQIEGYGGEMTIGTLKDDEIEIINNSDEEISDIIWGRETIDRHWSDIDDVYHNFNAGDSFTLRVFDEQDNELFSFDSEEILDNDESPVEVEYEDKYFVIDEPSIVCFSHEKGLFFLGDINVDEFDISKLKLVVHEDCGLHKAYEYGKMISEVLYDGEKVDNYGGDTTGKSFDVEKNF